MLLFVVAPGPAVADDRPAVYYDLYRDEKLGAVPPLKTDVIVVGGPNGVPKSSWTLAQVDVQPPAVMSAIDLRTHVDSRDNLAIALVVEGHKIFVGTDEYEVLDNHFPGVISNLQGVVAAISKADPTPTSEGMVIVYGRGARVLAPLQPLTKLASTSLGQQSDYELEVARDLVEGVKKALDGLLSTTAARKALIVVGDGADTNIDTARARLTELRKEAERARVELYAINYSAGIGDELSVIKALVRDPIIAADADQIEPAARAIVDRINDRFVLTFELPPTALDWCPHEFQLLLDGKPFPDHEPITYQPLVMFHVEMCKADVARRGARSDGYHWAWPLIFSLGTAVAVGVALYLNRRHRMAAARRGVIR